MYLSLFIILCFFFSFEIEAVTHIRHRRAQEEHLSSPAGSISTDIDPYNYTCSKAERLSDRCRWCNREYPSQDGVWAPLPPYWQFPGKCANQAFDADDTRKCLSGRTVYAIGNSVSRQTLFNLIEMLGGNPVSRAGQRDQCSKVELRWKDSCHHNYAGVKFKHLFMQYMDGLDYTERNGFPFFRYKDPVSGRWTTGKIARNATSPTGTGTEELQQQYYGLPRDQDVELWQPVLDGNCVQQDTRECLEHFFAGSTERDVAVFTLGMPYGFFMQPNRAEPNRPVSVDFEHWLVASAGAFRAHLSAAFKGQVFRITHAEFNPTGMDASRTPGLQRVNDLLWQVWQPGAEEKPWYTIDQWPINHGRHSLYDDDIHYNGPLTHASMHQVLNELCPGGGKTTWSHPLPGQSVTEALRAAPMVVLVKVALSATQNWYLVLANGTRHNVPNMDTLAGLAVPERDIVRLRASDLDSFPEGEPLVSCDPAYDPHKCTQTVYYKALHNT